MRHDPSAASSRFVQCQNCKKTLFAADFEANLKVCTLCSHHHRLTWRERIDWTFDEGSFSETDRDIQSEDPLRFPDYRPKYEAAQAKTGLSDSVVTGTAQLNSL